MGIPVESHIEDPWMKETGDNSISSQGETQEETQETQGIIETLEIQEIQETDKAKAEEAMVMADTIHKYLTRDSTETGECNYFNIYFTMIHLSFF